MSFPCRSRGLRPAAFSQRQEIAINFVTSSTVGFEAYLERQERNEFYKPCLTNSL